jgi:hypothetical protein
MTDTPKFEVIDRRKYKGEEEAQHNAAPEPAAKPEPQPPAPPEAAKSSGPRLVTPAPSEPASAPESDAGGDAEDEFAAEPPLPPPPTVEESREQKSAYDASSQRLEDLVRAQNPAAGAQPPMTFESLVQQLYVSAMIQMGAASTEGQRPRVDILGARQTIDLLGILQEKTKGNLTPTEERILDTVLFEARMAFLELTNMIAMPGVQAPPPEPKH